MDRSEFNGEHDGYMKSIVEGSGTGRIGTAEEIAQVAGPESSLITGTDILVGGGAIVGQLWAARQAWCRDLGCSSSKW
jgi:meso-butanediol dehydrogenase/(S,S)-butanediol dehydrogenase/diacetyl reductase